jgi:hypothetical protein
MGPTGYRSPDPTRSPDGTEPPLFTRLPPQRISTFVSATYSIPRHSFTVHLPGGGYDIRTMQECLGHKHVKAAICDIQLLTRGEKSVRRPCLVGYRPGFRRKQSIIPPASVPYGNCRKGLPPRRCERGVIG